MNHVKSISRTRVNVQLAETTPLESLIVLVFTIYFGDWTNGPAAIQNLAKYYEKT